MEGEWFVVAVRVHGEAPRQGLTAASSRSLKRTARLSVHC